MTSIIAIPDDLKDRVEALSTKTTMSPAETIRQALVEGRSLEWQEEWLRKVEEGKAAADRSEFATQEHVDRVLNKYRPT